MFVVKASLVEDQEINIGIDPVLAEIVKEEEIVSPIEEEEESSLKNENEGFYDEQVKDTELSAVNDQSNRLKLDDHDMGFEANPNFSQFNECQTTERVRHVSIDWPRNSSGNIFEGISTDKSSFKDVYYTKYDFKEKDPEQNDDLVNLNLINEDIEFTSAENFLFVQENNSTDKGYTGSDDISF
jgi:hypothetical protein